jgi:hypothetical protein
MKDDIDFVAARRIADSCWALVNEHEKVVHDGERCDEERANLLAFIAHRMGFGRRALEILLERMNFYQMEHEKAGL